MDSRIIGYAKRSGFDAAALLSFVEVETGGRGFDYKTGKIIIQFEGSWFKKRASKEFARYQEINSRKEAGEQLKTEEVTYISKWNNILSDKVSVQFIEWNVFNTAFSINPNAAMESTSIGLGQIMGFHWQRLGYGSVGEMWDDAKDSLERQFAQLVMFISTDKALLAAIKAKDWNKIALIYNGAGYKTLAAKLGREPYDASMAKAYEQFKKVLI